MDHVRETTDSITSQYDQGQAMPEQVIETFNQSMKKQEKFILRNMLGL
jgi:hypothetical protein